MHFDLILQFFERHSHNEKKEIISLTWSKASCWSFSFLKDRRKELFTKALLSYFSGGGGGVWASTGHYVASRNQSSVNFL